MAREKSGKKFSVIVVAEGIKPLPEMRAMFDREKRAYPRAGAVGNLIGDAIGMCIKKEVRVTVLGHTQRGGTPSPFDRWLATRFGLHAIDAVHDGDFGKMVALRGTDIIRVPLKDATATLKTVPMSLYEEAKVFFG